MAAILFDSNGKGIKIPNRDSIQKLLKSTTFARATKEGFAPKTKSDSYLFKRRSKAAHFINTNTNDLSILLVMLQPRMSNS